jgi:hypothetical protein
MVIQIYTLYNRKGKIEIRMYLRFYKRLSRSIGMNKTFKSIIFTGSLLIISATACNLIISQTSPVTPAPTANPTETATSAPTATSTESVPTASATPEFAPFCQPEDAASVSPSAQCRVPIAEESSTFCTDKDPYNLILFDKGLTYEVLTKGFRCSDAGIKGDKQMVTCTGQMAADFAINVCDPACVIPTVQAAITKCQQGYNYNAQQGCCTQEIQQLNPNCVAFKFKTTSCVVRCFEFRREAKCKRNSWACEWNEKEKVCELRK